MNADNHSPQLKRILRLAAIEAERDQSGTVEVHHTLIGMLMDADNTGAELLRNNGVDIAQLRALDFEKRTKAP